LAGTERVLRERERETERERERERGDKRIDKYKLAGKGKIVKLLNEIDTSKDTIFWFFFPK
jgi:hypothetical protein